MELPDGIKLPQQFDPLNAPIREIVRREIIARYLHFKKQKNLTAKSLGISRSTLYRFLNEYGIV